MSENNAKPDPQAVTGEFDFAGPVNESPRVKRRSLKPQQPAAPKPEAAASAEPRETAQPAPTRPAASTTSQPATGSQLQPNAYQINRPKPATTAPSQTTSPHGTRPATLYYSSGQRPEKETTTMASSQKPTSSAGTTSSTTASSASSAARSAAPSTTTTSSFRPTSVSDYRANVERQAREQHSMGGILNIIVYVLIGGFVIGFSLAGYGAYVLSKQIQQQSVTVSDLDKRYAADNRDLNIKLATTMDSLTAAQAQIAREQELILKQQEVINKLLATTQDTAAALRQEKSTRAEETASIRARLRNLEYKGPTTQRY